MRRYVLAAAVLAAGFLAPRTGYAAERWVDRPMTLHELVFAGDVGLGIGHIDNGGGPRLFRADATGVGLNVEGAIGITERVELGLRTGIRFGDDAKFTVADYYGRTNQTETYDYGFRTFANPEFRVKWVAYSGSVAEVGLDGRIYLPTDPDNSRFGIMFGVPLAFHLSDFMRIDTGVYIPTVFTDPVNLTFSVPADFWFQVNEKLWLGPMIAMRFNNLGNRAENNHFLLGFGMGYQVARAVDLKWQFQAPAIDNGLHYYGAGFGVQFRLGE